MDDQLRSVLDAMTPRIRYNAIMTLRHFPVATETQLMVVRFVPPGKLCDDCGREAFLDDDLHTAHSGLNYHEDFKEVCRNGCVFTCQNGHPVISHCPLHFIADYMQDYSTETYNEIQRHVSHFEECPTCGAACWVVRDFLGDLHIENYTWRYKAARSIQRWWRNRSVQ